MTKEDYRKQTLLMIAENRLPPSSVRAESLHLMPCIHEGAVLEFCKTCTGAPSELRHVRDCDLHDRCTRGVNGTGVKSCAQCSDHDNGLPRPVITKPSLNALAPGDHGFRFNPSLIDFQGRRLLAYRTGWAGSNVAVSEMIPDGSFGPYHVLDLFFHQRANYGREDPRLFIHDNKLHVSYIGVSGVNGPTHQMYARLKNDLSTDAIFYPYYRNRRSWEKNWQFFSHGGQLYAVYDVVPHVVLAIYNNKTELVHHTDWKPEWTGGLMRGGAAPVLVGDEYWCWFHGRRDPQRLYNLSVYCFEAKPPFAPTRYLQEPLYFADKKTKPADQYVAVTWPGGAILENGKWLIACGVHDRWIEFHEYDHKSVESCLREV